MRHQQWRLLLLQTYHRSHLPSPFSQVPSITTRSISSFLHSKIKPSNLPESLYSLRTLFTNSVSLMGRTFSSESEVKTKSFPEFIVIDVFSRLSNEDEIKKELELNDIVISQDLALKVLRKLKSNPVLVKRFFEWVTKSEEVTSNCYNMMLRILGGNGLIEDFWGLVDVMKKKGHGLSVDVRDKVGEKFEEDRLSTQNQY